MWPVSVVVRDEFVQHGPEVLLVQHDNVVQTLTAECADASFGDCVRLWRVNRRSDGINPDRPKRRSGWRSR